MKRNYCGKTGHIALKISSFIAVFVLLVSTPISAQLVHPGGWHTQDDLTLIRTKVAAGEEPWISGWNAIKNESPKADYTTSASPMITSNGAMSGAGFASWVLAMKWVASGDQAYADAAINVINEWVNTVTDFDVYGPTLTLSTGAGAMAQAAEILEHAFNGAAGWPQSEADAAKSWFVNVIYDPFTNIGDMRSTNWGTSCVGGNMSMAIFCDDVSMFEYQRDAYLYGYQDTDDGCAAVTDYIFDASGQAQESGRDQAHVQGGIAHLTEAALCAWNQGVDLVSVADNRLLAGVEYHAKYNLYYDDLPFTTDVYNPCDLPLIQYWDDAISEEERGNFSPVYCLSSKLFSLAGLEHPYTEEVIALSSYSPEINNFAHPGLGMFAFVATGEQSFTPYLTTEAEDYIAMSGVDTTTTTDERGGYKISSIDANDWMEYEITIPLSGTFLFDYRVSGVSEGDFQVELNGEAIDTISFDATGGDEIWTSTRSTSPIYLSEGTDTIRITSTVTGWNLNWIQLISNCYESSITPRINTIDLQGVESGLVETSEVTVLPDFSVDLSPLPDVYGTWNWIGPNGFTSDEREVSLSAIQKNQRGEYIAVHTNDCGVESRDTFSINVQDSLLIEAENYTLMNAVSVEATSDISGDSSVTSILSDSWMEYEVEVPFSALYTFSYRVASDNEASFDLSVNSEVIDQVAFNSTGGTQTWTSVNSESTVYLKAGLQTLRISSKTEGWNINWLQLNALQAVRECMLPYTSDGFTVRRDSVVWSSGVLDISCETDVDIHVILEGIGTFGESDYLRAYYKLDNEDKILIAEKTDALSESMISVEALVGTTVELIIESQTVKSTARYIISKMLVLKGSDPLAKIEAEDYDEAYGTNTETCRDTGGGENVGSINSENWLKFSNINLSEVHSVDMRLASTLSGGTVEVRLDSETGDIIGSLEMPNTGNWQTWETITASLENRVGFYDVYIVFVSSEKYVGNINWLQFSTTIIGGSSAIEVIKTGTDESILYPNPVGDILNILDNAGSELRVISPSGKIVLQNKIKSNHHRESFSDLAPGVYVVQLLKGEKLSSYRVVRK